MPRLFLEFLVFTLFSFVRNALRLPRPVNAPGQPPSGAWRTAQFTFTALQAAATAMYSALPAPYRSFAAFRVAVRAPA